MRFTRYGLGDKVYKAKNPPNGALISYMLPEDMGPGEGATAKTGPSRVKLEILDGAKVIRQILKPPTAKGINRVAWDLKFDGPKPRREGDNVAGDDFSPPLDGPAALPGGYTVRLSVDGKSVETAVEVRIDPLVKVSTEALRVQHELATRLGGMITEANLLLRGLDGIKVQLDERKKSLEALGRTLSKDAQKALDEYSAAHEKVFDRVGLKDNIPFYSEPPRIPGRLLELMSSLDDGYAAPTPGQREYAKKLEEKLEEAKAAYKALLEGPFAAMNAAFTKESLPALVRP